MSSPTTARAGNATPRAVTGCSDTTPPAPGVDARRTLARCRALVRPALSAAIGRLHPWTGEMAAFSLGWCEAGGAPRDPSSEGKGVRLALAVLCAEAVGAPGESAVPGAVAVELVHAFSLMHDDIMDGDVTRRRRETVWKAYGTGPAVLAGDALLALAVQTLAEVPGPRAGALVGRLSETLGELVRGQAEDLLFESRPWTGPEVVRPAEYRAMAELKTGTLLGCAAALGAQLGGAPARTVTALDLAGRHLGVAFQAVDDLLGIWGDPEVTGKPVHSDLRQHKKTYPVLAALAADTVHSGNLLALLTSSRRLDGERAKDAAALVEACGGRTATVAEARRHLDAARACLRSVPLAPEAAREAEGLLGFLLHRTV